jgi:TPR repeat protein
MKAMLQAEKRETAMTTRTALLAAGILVALVGAAVTGPFEDELRRAGQPGLTQSLAEYNLGVMYRDGDAVPQNDAEAVRWFRKSADHGLANAMNNLGVMYRDGRGVPQNDAEAVNWFRKATEAPTSGYADAEYSLGFMYANGRGVPQNDADAVRRFRKAADLGDADAQYALGGMYANGRGVLQNYTEAANWYRKAAAQRHAYAAGALAKLYADERQREVVPPNTAEVVEVLKEAAAAFETGLREKPWMEGYLRALGINPRTGPMPPLSPAETRCRQVMQRRGQGDLDQLQRDLDRCVAGLRKEWMSSH